MSRLSCSTRASSSRCRSAVRCASRSRLSCSILKRARTAPLAASWSRNGCSCAGRVRLRPQRLGLRPRWRARPSPALRPDWPPRRRPGACDSAHRRCSTMASSLRISVGDLLVAARLPCLPLQALDLRVELAQDVVEAGEIALGGAQAQLRLVPAAVQAGDAGGVLQDAAALLGLGVDQLADLALTYQGRRAGAGGGILEQDAHVAGTHLAAVDADRPSPPRARCGASLRACRGR